MAITSTSAYVNNIYSTTVTLKLLRLPASCFCKWFCPPQTHPCLRHSNCSWLLTNPLNQTHSSSSVSCSISTFPDFMIFPYGSWVSRIFAHQLSQTLMIQHQQKNSCYSNTCDSNKKQFLKKQKS